MSTEKLIDCIQSGQCDVKSTAHRYDFGDFPVAISERVSVFCEGVGNI